MSGWTPKTPPEVIRPGAVTQKHSSRRSSWPGKQDKQLTGLQAAAEEALDAQTKASTALQTIVTELRLKSDNNEKTKVKLAERDEEVATLNRHMNKLREIIETQLGEIIQLGFDKSDLEAALEKEKEKKNHGSEKKEGAAMLKADADTWTWGGNGKFEKGWLQSKGPVKEAQNIDSEGWFCDSGIKDDSAPQEDLVTLRAINQGQADRITLLECRNRELEKDRRDSGWR